MQPRPARVNAVSLGSAAMPRFWIWMQVVIVVCVAASIVIALTKLY
jgi:hypothetical protein